MRIRYNFIFLSFVFTQQLYAAEQKVPQIVATNSTSPKIMSRPSLTRKDLERLIAIEQANVGDTISKRNISIGAGILLLLAEGISTYGFAGDMCPSLITFGLTGLVMGYVYQRKVTKHGRLLVGYKSDLVQEKAKKA